jgi:hypothetical protein
MESTYQDPQSARGDSNVVDFASVADALADDNVRIYAHTFHACMYCGRHDCDDRANHTDWHRTHENTKRVEPKLRNACTTCGRDTKQEDGPCVTTYRRLVVTA